MQTILLLILLRSAHRRRIRSVCCCNYFRFCIANEFAECGQCSIIIIIRYFVCMQIITYHGYQLPRPTNAIHTQCPVFQIFIHLIQSEMLYGFNACSVSYICKSIVNLMFACQWISIRSTAFMYVIHWSVRCPLIWPNFVAIQFNRNVGQYLIKQTDYLSLILVFCRLGQQ